MIEHWHFEPPLHKRPLTHHRPLHADLWFAGFAGLDAIAWSTIAAGLIIPSIS